MASREHDERSTWSGLAQSFLSGFLATPLVCVALVANPRSSILLLPLALVGGALVMHHAPLRAPHMVYLLAVAGVAGVPLLSNWNDAEFTGPLVGVLAAFAAIASAPFLGGGGRRSWCGFAAGGLASWPLLEVFWRFSFGPITPAAAALLLAWLAARDPMPEPEPRSVPSPWRAPRVVGLAASMTILLFVWSLGTSWFASEYGFRLLDGVVTAATMAGLALGILVGGWTAGRAGARGATLAFALAIVAAIAEFAFVHTYSGGDMAAFLRPYLPFGWRHRTFDGIPLALLAFGTISIPLGFAYAHVPSRTNPKAAWWGMAIGLSAMFLLFQVLHGLDIVTVHFVLGSACVVASGALLWARGREPRTA